MRSYECAVVFYPTVDEGGLEAETRKYAELISTQGGEITRLETWGKRRLAYEIDHQQEGHYFFYRFRGEAGVLDELGRHMRIDERVLRHMIVRDEFATGAEPTVAVSDLQAQERTEKPDRFDRSDRSDRSDRFDRPGRSDRSRRTEKPERGGA